ncbi:MAG TPA: hypothetical protein VLA34_13920, partial [Candidatus Krumholzibacterium sp.]|nr:hypothetical protein [Candidatus Krumholzibacterium sp.]
ADPCLVVYPGGLCEYRYDVTEYYTVEYGDSLYQAEYDRGGKVLLEMGTSAIDLSIYQAPMIDSFQPSYDGMEGYFFYSNTFTLVIDGFSNEPVDYSDVIVVFENLAPGDCEGTVVVNGMTVEGNTYNAGSLSISTPVPYGNSYSDTIVLQVEWYGCYGMYAWAYADTDGDGMHAGGECFTAFSHDVTIGTSPSTWGNIKSLYK